MDWMLMAWKKYADFSGRARRKEYWMFQLGVFVAYIAIMVVTAILGAISETLAYVGVLAYGALALGAIVPSISAGVRRLMTRINRAGSCCSASCRSPTSC